MRVSRRLMEGAELPFGWGLAWYEPSTATAVILPIPINVIAGWSRELWLLLMFKLQPKWVQKRDREIWLTGYRKGKQ